MKLQWQAIPSSNKKSPCKVSQNQALISPPQDFGKVPKP
jgi:hypothetical protein